MRTIVVVRQNLLVPEFQFNQPTVLVFILGYQLIDFLHQFLRDEDVREVLTHGDKLRDALPGVTELREILFDEETHEDHAIEVKVGHLEFITDGDCEFVVGDFVDDSVQDLVRRVHEYFAGVDGLVFL